MERLQGICPIIPAVFADDGTLDPDGCRRCCDALARHGAQALALFGIAGEYYKLDRDEEEGMIAAVMAGGRARRLPVVVSNTRHATRPAVQWARRIEAAGADVMMVLPPFFLKPSGSELLKHLSAVCDAVSIPVMLQYAPEQTGVALPPETLAELGRRHANLHYYKIECKPPGGYITRLLELLDGRGAVYVGNAGFQMVEGYRRGAVGAMPGASMTDVYRQIHDDLRAGRDDAALAKHEKLNALLNHIRQDVEMIIAYEKMIMKRRGWIASDHCRAPCHRPDSVGLALFEELYRGVEPLFAREDAW